MTSEEREKATELIQLIQEEKDSEALLELFEKLDELLEQASFRAAQKRARLHEK